MLHHYVMMKFQSGTSAEHIAVFSEKMLALPALIEQIEHLEIGRDELHEGRSWDLILIMRFHSVEALRSYQKHPEHLAVMQFNNPFVDTIAAVDFHESGK